MCAVGAGGARGCENGMCIVISTGQSQQDDVYEDNGLESLPSKRWWDPRPRQSQILPSFPHSSPFPTGKNGKRLPPFLSPRASGLQGSQCHVSEEGACLRVSVACLQVSRFKISGLGSRISLNGLNRSMSNLFNVKVEAPGQGLPERMIFLRKRPPRTFNSGMDGCSTFEVRAEPEAKDAFGHVTAQCKIVSFRFPSGRSAKFDKGSQMPNGVGWKVVKRVHTPVSQMDGRRGGT